MVGMLEDICSPPFYFTTEFTVITWGSSSQRTVNRWPKVPPAFIQSFVEE